MVEYASARMGVQAPADLCHGRNSPCQLSIKLEIRKGQHVTRSHDIRYLSAGDANAIARIVGREHVGEPARLVARRMSRKVKGFKRLDRGLQAAILRHARRVHRGNFELFRQWRF